MRVLDRVKKKFIFWSKIHFFLGVDQDMMEGEDTGSMSELEKKGMHQAVGILENYGIASETDVSLLDQGDLRNLVSQGLKTCN